MLETILEWLGASDRTIQTMGPTLTIIFAWLGGWGITQLVKFPLSHVCKGEALTWVIRVFAVLTTFFVVHLLDQVKFPVALSVALIQPVVYKFAMSAIRKFWPWAEATKTLGSVAPSVESITALNVLRGKKD